MTVNNEKWVKYWEVCLEEFRNNITNYRSSKLNEKQVQILVTHCNDQQWIAVVSKHPKLTVSMVEQRMKNEPSSDRSLLYAIAYDRYFYPEDDELLKFLIRSDYTSLLWVLAENYRKSVYDARQLETVWKTGAVSKWLRKLLIIREPQKGPYLTKQMCVEAYVYFGHMEEDFISKHFDSVKEFRDELITYAKTVLGDAENLEQLPLEWVQQLVISLVTEPETGG